jgi:hypothetical protein
MRIVMMFSWIGLVLAANAGSAQTVTYDFDESADFSRLKTYAWVRGTPVVDDLNHKRIVAAVDAQLIAKGLRYAAGDEQPDVLVAYHANFERDLRINASSSDWGSIRFGSNRTGTANVQELLTGTLVVEMFDVRNQAVVWKGIATREIDAKASPERRTKNIHKAAEKLFKHYPPGK